MTSLFFLFDKFELTTYDDYKLEIDKICGRTLEWRLDRFNNRFAVINISRKQFYGIPFCDTYIYGIDKQLDNMTIWNYHTKSPFNYKN
jgi:hypothetical protein